MELASLQAITGALMIYINAAMSITDSQIAAPEVRFVPKSEIEAKACEENSCRNVLGWFSNDDQVVYLKNTLDVQNSMHARGILLHELVHYVQYMHDSPKLANDCLTWKAREIQAYEIQYHWLYDNRVRIRTPSYGIALANFERLRCPEVEDDITNESQ